MEEDIKEILTALDNTTKKQLDEAIANADKEWSEMELEEDIKILEDLFYDDESFEPNGYVEIFLHKNEQEAIKHLIARNKELEQNYINPSKARFTYFDNGKGTKVVVEGFIPKSKVRELLKEIDEANFDEGWWYEEKIKKLLED